MNQFTNRLPNISLSILLLAALGLSGLAQGQGRGRMEMGGNQPLEVMVTLTCPDCPKMVRVAHQLAFASEFIRAEMVNSAEFPQLVQRYDVHGVPRTAINGRGAAQPGW